VNSIGLETTSADAWAIEVAFWRRVPARRIASISVTLPKQNTINTATERILANERHHSIRAQAQRALFDPAKSTAEIVGSAITWAQGLPPPAADSPASNFGDEDDHDDDREFNSEWDRRAVVMAAALAVRDYAAPDRSTILEWARDVLVDAANASGKAYHGNDQVGYITREPLQRSASCSCISRSPASRHATSS
jgi:hypothetical protein